MHITKNSITFSPYDEEFITHASLIFPKLLNKPKQEILSGVARSCYALWQFGWTVKKRFRSRWWWPR